MGLIQFSETNIVNSVALLLAADLLSAGYLLYWHDTDVVQTPDGFYYRYREQQATYLADATYAARVAGAKGLITLKGEVSSNPEHPTRPTSDGSVPAKHTEIAIPSLAVEVGPQMNGRLIEVGTRIRKRWRHLAIYGYARDAHEQKLLRDSLAVWFDEERWILIKDHDAQTLAEVGLVELTKVSTDSAMISGESDATTFELILNARLEYEA